MKSGGYFKHVALTGTGLALAVTAGSALAQQAAAQQATVPTTAEGNDIVVTATRRDEKLQNVPASITAFSAQTIERSNITRPIDFINATPNLSAVEANNAGDLRITIRGDAQALNTDAPVAVLIDGVVLTGATGLNKDLLDVQQIEVLKGPQGYLYGRDAIAGAINITTRAPSDRFEGLAKFSYGNGSSYRGQIAVSGPIIAGKLGASFAGSIRDGAGFYRDITTNRLVDPYNEKSGRLRLDWTPSDRLTVEASAFYSKIEGAATNYISQSLFPGLQTSSPIVSADYAGAPFVSNIQSFNHKTDQLYALKINYDTGFGKLTSTSSFERQQNIFASDGFPYTSGTGDGTQYNQREHSARTTELRFTSPGGKPVRYVVGGYYADISETPFLLAAVGVDDIGSIIDRQPPITSGPNQTTGLSIDNIYSKAWALFANVDWDIASQLTLTLAGRYDHEAKRAIDVAYGNSSVTGMPFSATAGQIRRGTYEQFQPKIALAYRPASNVSLYATYANGFKAGGFNAAQAFTVTGGSAPNQYPQEKANNYEVGAKTSWLNGALTANLSLFRTYKDNSHLFQFIPTGFLNAVTVVDKIRVTGGEFELVARPTHQLTVRGGVGYVNAKITRDIADPTAVGKQAPYIPDLKVTLNADYEIPLGGETNLILNGGWDHTGREFFDAKNSPLARRSALDLFSARTTLQFDRWSLSAWSKNLTDKRYNSDVIVIFTGTPLPFTQAVFKAPPRTYGVDLSVRF